MEDTSFEFMDTDSHTLPSQDGLISEQMKMSNVVYDAIAHGDNEHREWLKNKLNALFVSMPQKTIEVFKPSQPVYRPGIFDPGIYPQDFDAPSIGIKYDSGKPRPSLLPIDAVMEVVKVLEFGAKKYGENNWQQVTPPMRYFDAALRHLFSWAMGEKFDPETNLSHFAHAATCILFLLHFHTKGQL